MQKIIFLDTNVYLHYQDFDQINWLEVTEADHVTVVVPPITIHELNKHKDLHPRPRVKKRAGDTLKKLFTLFSSASQAQFRNGIAIILEDREPLIDFSAFLLSREVQDDNLIASIIMCKNETPGVEIVLVTSDHGLTLLGKARRHGITTIKLPDNLKLPEEPDPDQEKIRKLEQEIRELKRTMPQLSLIFEDSNQYATFILQPSNKLPCEKIEEELREIRKKYPKKTEELKKIDKQQSTNSPLVELANSMSTSLLSILSTADINGYNAELEKFYQDYAIYLQNKADFQSLKHTTVKLTIWLVNDGTAPAEDIDILLHFPDGFNLIDEKEFLQSPAPPTPPVLPETIMEKLGKFNTEMYGLSSYMISPPNIPNLQPPNVSSPNIRRTTNSYGVEIEVRRLKHKFRVQFDPLYVVFESFNDANSFQVDYQILAANLPNEVSGKLHVVIQKDK